MKLHIDSISNQVLFGKAKNYELTDSGLKVWLPVGIANIDLVYNDSVETILPDDLNDNKSIASLIGAPICLNHPPGAVMVNRIGVRDKYQVGTCLQQYEYADSKLMIAGLIWDKDAINNVMDSNIYTSSGYTCTKVQADSVGNKYHQKNRRYDHVAVLTKEYAPRAGIDSRILLINDSIEEMDKEAIAKEVQERVELMMKFSDLIEAGQHPIDYSEDSQSLKRKILSSSYTEDSILKDLSDDELNGFWKAFVLNYDAAQKETKQISETNFDSATTGNAREEFIKRLSRPVQ